MSSNYLYGILATMGEDIENALVAKLFKNYNRGVIPRENKSEPLTVFQELSLYNIINLVIYT